ncbi:hypothetical protein JW872_01065 [Candidatus Babeliales bacterium]|nr:hypothetical protein [Candidatus Babeliales bacterium]
MRHIYLITATVIFSFGALYCQDDWDPGKGKGPLTPEQQDEQDRYRYIQDHFEDFVAFVRLTAEDDEEFDEFMSRPDLRRELEDRFIQAEVVEGHQGPVPESWEDLASDIEEKLDPGSGSGEIFIPPTSDEAGPATPPVAGEEPSYFETYREGFMQAWDRWMEAIKSLPAAVFTSVGSGKLFDLVIAPSSGHLQQELIDTLKRNLRDPEFDLARALVEDAGFRTALEELRPQNEELNALFQQRLAQIGPAPVTMAPQELPPAVLPPAEDLPPVGDLALPTPVEAHAATPKESLSRAESAMSLDSIQRQTPPSRQTLTPADSLAEEEFPTLAAAAATPRTSRRDRQQSSPMSTSSVGTITPTRSPNTRLTPELRPETPAGTQGQHGPLNETVLRRDNTTAHRTEYDIYDAQNNAQITLFFPDQPLWPYGQLDFAHFDYPTQEEFARGEAEEGHVLDWFTRGGQDVRTTRAYAGSPEHIREQIVRHRWTITVDNFIPTQGNWFNQGLVFRPSPTTRHVYIIGRIQIGGGILWGAFRYIFMRRGNNWWVIQRYFVLPNTPGLYGVITKEIIKQQEQT